MRQWLVYVLLAVLLSPIGFWRWDGRRWTYVRPRPADRIGHPQLPHREPVGQR